MDIGGLGSSICRNTFAQSCKNIDGLSFPTRTDTSVHTCLERPKDGLRWIYVFFFLVRPQAPRHRKNRMEQGWWGEDTCGRSLAHCLFPTRPKVSPQYIPLLSVSDRHRSAARLCTSLASYASTNPMEKEGWWAELMHMGAVGRRWTRTTAAAAEDIGEGPPASEAR